VGGGKTQFCIIFNERMPPDGSRLFCHPSCFLLLQQKTKKRISAQLAIIDSKKNLFLSALCFPEIMPSVAEKISVSEIGQLKKGGGE